ncbi:MAG: glycosyltransferase, partial [Candidatus Aminicenantes bacterium]|nr:glycosyltransferase [Candidatus Aminicenantes bacterium]
MKKIKVVHIITRLELGGAQVNTVYTYEHLDDSKFEAYLLSGGGGMLDDRVEKKENFIIVPDLVREINPVKDIKAFGQVKRILKKINPDVIHTHSSKAGIIGRFVASRLRKSGLPAAVHSVHGFAFSPFQSPLKRKIYKWIEKIAAPLTSHFVFVAHADVDIARQENILKKDNFSLIRSGFPLTKFTAKNEETKALRKKYQIKEKDFVCGIIAPFKPQKGLFHLIEIAVRVLNKRKDVIFLIAGDGELRGEIEAELKKRGIFENFRLPGFLFDIEKAIDIFDIGVSTALWEGLPQSLIQLRLKKKAVVASSIPGNREVIKDNKNGFLVDVLDYESFAGKILYLLENKEEREQLGGFAEDFSAWDADYMVKVQEELYLSLGGRPPSREAASPQGNAFDSKL